MQRSDVMEMVIGYHKLEGDVVILKKPFAMLEKQTCTSNEEDSMEIDGPAATAYKVITQKSRMRPRPNPGFIRSSSHRAVIWTNYAELLSLMTVRPKSSA